MSLDIGPSRASLSIDAIQCMCIGERSSECGRRVSMRVGESKGGLSNGSL